MKNCQRILIWVLLIIACKGKHGKRDHLNGPTLFFDSYKPFKLPFYAVDSTMQAQASDTTISMKSFAQYFPDSIFNEPFGNNRNITLKPIGRIEQKGKENYFITLAKGAEQSAMYLSVFDSNRHTVTLPIIVNENTEIIRTATIDKKLTVVVNKEWMIKNDLYYNRVIYAYNNVGLFTTVLTETNEQRRTSDVAIANPIDTFPKKNKLSGEYFKDPKNYLIIRDGSNINEYLFFVHFQTGNAEEPCSGELKGKLKLTQEYTGQYSNTGDPCNLIFSFSGSQAIVKENGSCGNYRDIKCFFDDTFIKKKEPKTKERKKH